MSSAREDILKTIGKYTAQTALRETDYLAISRQYQTRSTMEGAQLVEMFIERLNDYGCAVHRTTQAEISDTIGTVLSDRKKSALMVTGEVPSDWLPRTLQFKQETSVSYRKLDEAEGVVTGCKVAIAVTGTIVLSHSSAEGNRAFTLIPDYHLCVVFESQIVETVVEAFRKINASDQRPLLTTISGPSATADIEMTRIKGVHGPRTLEVVLVAE
jgi:L-lactate dehydrogenase complex protein LldG